MDKDTRNILFNTTQAIRRGLEEEFRLQLEGTFDVHEDGRIEEQAGAPLNDRQKLTRRKIVQAIEHRRAMGEKAGESVKGFIREAAFTFLNRLAALKMMEARGIVQECVSTCGWRDGKADTEAVFEPRGFKEFSGLAPGLVELPDKGYRLYLECLFDEVGREVGVLFDRTDSASLLWPRRKALADALTLLNAPGLEGIWSEDETIGWIYQYYNDPEERAIMRDPKRGGSAAPRNSREMAVRNQFFTPRYVVEFLTDNSLGRLWYEMTKGKTRLKDQCRYLIRRPVEWFLPDPNTVFWHDSPGQAEFRKFCETASPHDLPAEPSLGMLLGWVSHVKRLGFEEDLRIIGLTHQRVVDEILTPLEQGRPSERLDSSHPIELMQSLWRLAYELDKHGYGRPMEPVSADPVAGPVWNRLREHFLNPPSGLSKEEALKLPAFIPHRPIKDPREIRMLDPACGSMHFGLYTFDLFLTIYEEAWQWGLIAKADFGFPQPPFPHASVRLRAGLSQVHSNDLHEDIPVATARVVVLAKNDAGDGLWTRGPYLAPPERKYRPAIVWETPLKDFHYPQAIAEGRFTPEEGEQFVRQTRCWDHDRADGSTEDEVEVLFARQIPALIIEHNIHGIDIDPRAAQMAGLAMWLRAQRHWQSMGLKAVDRPTIRKSNIVCAEPMPGEKELLGAFVRESFRASEQPFFQKLLDAVFEKMQIAGEAGALLQIEEEIRSLVHEARDAWRKLGKRSGELFSEAELARSDLRTGTQLKLDLGSWSLDALSGIPDAEFWEQAEGRIYEALRVFSEKADSTGFQRRLFAEDAARGFAFIDLCRQRYDVALMNPPFGSFTVSCANGANRAFGRLANDIYACFVRRIGDMLLDGGYVGIISSRSFVTGRGMEALRPHLLGTGETWLRLLWDFGVGVLDGAMVETAAYVYSRSTHEPAQPVIFWNDKATDKSSLQFPSTERSSVRSYSFFRNLPAQQLIYEADDDVVQHFKSDRKFEPHLGRVTKGLSTCSNERFVRCLWEVPQTELGLRWEFLSKGGEYRWLSCDLHLALNWNGDGEELAVFSEITNGNAARARQSSSYYFKPAVCFSGRSQKGFSARWLPAQCIFDTKSPVIVPEDASDLPWIAPLLMSSEYQRLISLQSKFGSYDTSAIGRLPMPSSTLAALTSQLNEIWTPHARLEQGLETTWYFVKPAADLAALRADAIKSLSMIEEMLNSEGYALDSTVSSHTKNAISSHDCFLGAENRWLSYSLGCAFGRWDIRFATGERPAPGPPAPFDPLPVCPPGMLQNERGMPATPAEVPADYPLSITWSGILVDDPGHPEHDIGSRLQQVLEVLFPANADAIETEACTLLGVRSLRDWFMKPTGFFADHLKRYSKSRRQAPIYWPLSSPKGLYTIWLYYHRLNADTLFTALRDYLEPKLQYEEQRAFQLKQDAGPTPSPSQRDYIVEAEDLVEDLRSLRDELQRVAPLFRPNLNDGVILNCAPLWRVMGLNDWQNDCQAAWDSLAKGDYDWAHLALQLWPERVIPKCATDRSLAIAHDLEDTFWEITPEDELPKKQQGKGTIVWRSKKVSSENLQTLITTHTSPAVKAALEELAKAPVAGGGKKGRRSAQ